MLTQRTDLTFPTLTTLRDNLAKFITHPAPTPTRPRQDHLTLRVKKWNASGTTDGQPGQAPSATLTALGDLRAIRGSIVRASRSLYVGYGRNIR
jgi:hypothetical protein